MPIQYFSREVEYLATQALRAEAEDSALKALKRACNAAWATAHQSARESEDGLMNLALVRAAYQAERRLLRHIESKRH